jgi:hypothetical protein
MYPRDTKDPTKAGRLRLMYEANPIGFLIEQAGGRASTGESMLGIRPASCTSALVWSSAPKPKSSVSRNHHRNPAAVKDNSPVRRAQPLPQRWPIAAAAHAHPFQEPDPCAERHPIIAITGSSGARHQPRFRAPSTSSAAKASVPAIVEGDSFHRYDRQR